MKQSNSNFKRLILNTVIPRFLLHAILSEFSGSTILLKIPIDNNFLSIKFLELHATLNER